MRLGMSNLALTALMLTLGAEPKSLATPKIISLPAETAALKETSEPGYQLTANACAACHSVDYIVIQPRGKGKEFWSGEVMKMVNVYGATVEESDRPAIIDYLARNY
jgi:sulfite dehydrogenase (cytochrome) subunit B